ncbi:MAG: hypothetical protein MI922_02615 [Bacteroidales bacterium]|nr:hypothetical protein [Bacteroidales bacterium]
MAGKITLEKIADITYKENKILLVEMAKMSNINVDEAKKLIKGIEQLVGSEVHCNLIDIRNMTFMSGEARKLFGGQDKRTVKAVGIVMNKSFQKALVNLYQKLSRPVLPTKIFDDLTEAENWLLTML